MVDASRQEDEGVKQIRKTHLNLQSGYQCVRDFFICIRENLEHWPDVYSNFHLLSDTQLNVVNAKISMSIRLMNALSKSLYLQMVLKSKGLLKLN